jgi:hypothetical protein
LGAIERELLDVVDQGDNLIALNILDHVQFSILAWTPTQRLLLILPIVDFTKKVELDKAFQDIKVEET